MSIEYVEIRNPQREIIGICDAFNSIIWRGEYYGTGDFEIYAPCSPLNLSLLVEDNIVTRPDDENVGIIEHVEYTFDITNGRMITASGRFAKSILDRRVIYRKTGTNQISATMLNGNVETTARSIITMNAINCDFDTGRNIDALILGAHSGSEQIIVDADGNPTTQQVAFDNLLTWTDEFLKKYKIGAKITLNAEKQFVYTCYEGVNRAVDNTDGNEPVIFSQDFENLISSNFLIEKSAYKNAAVVAGEGEGIARFCSFYVSAGLSGIDRRELFVDENKAARKYVDSGGTERTLTVEQYNANLRAIGAQKLAALPIAESFDGEINLNSLTFQYKRNYNIGDIITIQDSDTKIYSNTRIIEICEVQDEKGYQITGKYETD